MRRWNVFGILVVLVVILWGMSAGVDLKPIHTQKTKDVTIVFMSELGLWKQGANLFIFEFTMVDGKLYDVGKVSFSMSMSMSGMVLMIVGVILVFDEKFGCYKGMISFLDSGVCQVTVRWEGFVGKGFVCFSVFVR